jgi:hypothetical protein
VSDPFQDALASFRRFRVELQGLPVEVRLVQRLPRLEQLPRPPRVRTEDDEPSPALPLTLSPVEVAHGWQSRGKSWLDSLRRRDLSAVVAALGDPSVGPRLASEDAFVSALPPLLRPRQQWRALSALFFQKYLPSSALLSEVVRLKNKDPDRAPPWTDKVSQTRVFLASVAHAIAHGGWTAAREEFALPACVTTSGWALAIVKSATPTDLDQRERLLRFADDGEERQASAPLREAHVPVIKEMVAYGRENAGIRLQIASLLRRRVGEVFGVVAQASWRGLEDELRQIRMWVASEILDILFKHLVPDSEFAHHTEPRRLFWRKYTGFVDRLWLLIGPRLRQRLERGEVKDLLQRVGDVIEIRELQGQDQQAIVWIQLRSPRGEVTVIEGNANSRCRLGTGAYEPPRAGAVHYSTHIVHGALGDQRAHTFSQPHLGDWQRKVAHALLERGIRP